MTVNAHEQLSALLDGELAEAEAAMVVRRVARDEALRSAALRYSLIGDALRGDLPAGRPANLVARVRAELESVPVPAPGEATKQPARASRLVTYGAGVAVAASVALVALVALPGRQQEALPPLLSANEVASPVAEIRPEVRSVAQPVFTRAAGGGPDRLTRYYVNHTEFAPAMSGRGALTRLIMIQPEPVVGEEAGAEAADEPLEEAGNVR
jgi:sigma-E factor negative regulatory protein RseA